MGTHKLGDGKDNRLVFLDGVLVRDCLEANTEDGWVKYSEICIIDGKLRRVESGAKGKVLVINVDDCDLSFEEIDMNSHFTLPGALIINDLKKSPETYTTDNTFGVDAVLVDGIEIADCTACNISDGWAIYAGEPLRVDSLNNIVEHIIHGAVTIRFKNGDTLP